MSSLAEKILALTNPTPKVFDPEDDVNVETVAKIGAFDEGNNETLFTTSELRIKNAPLLEDIDPKYTGKRVSRKSLGGIFQDDKTLADAEDELQHSQNENDVDDDDEEESSDFDENEMGEDELSDTDLEKFKASFKSQISSDVEESVDEEESTESEGLSEEEEGESDDNSMVNKFSNIDVSSEIEKGQAVKDQQEIFNRLCECRIKLQKLLIIANQLPQASSWKILKQKGKDMTESINKSSNSTKVLLNNCLNLQMKLLTNNLETHEIVENQKQSIADDEEIPSDTDDEIHETPQRESPQKGEKRKLKRKLNCEEYGDILAKRHKSITPYRNSIIQKFYEKTRLAYGKVTKNTFSALDSSPLQQIEQILQDENRLIKRTQLKRSIYKILGKPHVPELKSDENSESSEIISKQDMLLKDYDPEIFDDDDFYRQLLKDIIDNRSVGIDPAVLRKQMEIQSVRNKLKKKVDTKASKGRRIRYDVHPKLVNYMAPIETCKVTDKVRDTVLDNIFGKASSR